MGKEYYLVDTHGGHNFIHRPPDDGLESPYENVSAARRKGVIPSQTSHNSMRAIPAYWEAMADYGYKDVRLPGVELSFHSEGAGLTTAGLLSSRDNVLMYAGPGSDRFANHTHTGHERNVRLRPEHIEKSRAFIEHTVIDFMASLGVDPERIIPEVSKGFWNLQALKILQGGVLDEPNEQSYEAAIGIWVALTEPGFAAFYSLVHDTDPEELIPDGQTVIAKFKEFPDMLRIVQLAWMYWEKEFTKDTKEKFKGEIICLMPQHPGLVKKVNAIVETWRESGYHKTMPLVMLFDFFTSNLTEKEFDALVWNFPHPVSIDITWPGKQIVHAMEGDVSLFSPELFIPEVAQIIDTIEVYNAAHPGLTNRVATEISGIDLLKHKGRTGGSDSHHPSWVGAGATLVAVDHLSTDGILDALKQGNTLPVSGLGKASTTIFPFFAWSLTIPVKGWNVTPQHYFRWLSSVIDARTPASRAIEQDSMHDPAFNGWAY